MRKEFSKISTLLTAVLLFMTVVSISSCSKDTPGPDQVFMQNTAFNPQSITVAVNSMVTWTNKDNMTHNVTSTTGAFVSGNIAPGATYTHQFTTAGTYNYTCTIHAGMTGSVVVH
jgi:plastocyanin